MLKWSSTKLFQWIIAGLRKRKIISTLHDRSVITKAGARCPLWMTALGYADDIAIDIRGWFVGVAYQD